MEIPNLPTSRGSGVVCEKFAIFDIIEVLKNQLLVLLMFTFDSEQIYNQIPKTFS